jgi:Fe-S oxidoreductase
MSSSSEGRREGSLEAPIRHPIDWNSDDFYNEHSLFSELERVYDICHGCRRCFNLCNAFPTLFDAIDESDTLELDGVPREVYWDVVDHCYLCDMCYMSKCPYVPPHEWNVDFPHLMLRAKAVRFKQGKVRTRDRILTSTDTVGKLAGIPIVVNLVNATNRSGLGRKVLDNVLGVHPDAIVPEYHSKTLRRRLATENGDADAAVEAGPTQGRVALFATCYGNYNEPGIGEDLVAVFAHNDIAVTLAHKEHCCGMPKLELGDLDAVRAARDANIPELVKLVDAGWDIVAPIPSCVLMFKQELPLMFPDDADVAKVRDAIYDPFEYLMIRHRHDLLKTDFKNPLGKIAYHVACHLRVQNIGMKTRDLLQLVPDTEVAPIERCSGHDGTYAVKSEYHEISMKICRPVINNVKKSNAAHYSSDCPMAGHQIENGLEDGKAPEHPLTLLRMAYGL